MSTFIGDLMYPSEEKYFSHGEEKTRWINCGGVFKNDAGQISVKITALPTVMDSNWFRCFPPRDQQQGGQASRPAPKKQPDLPEDDLPF